MRMALSGVSLAQSCAHGAVTLLCSAGPVPGAGTRPRDPLGAAPVAQQGEARGAPEPAAQEGAEGQREPWCQAKRDAEGAQSTACAGETPQGIYAGPVPEVCSLLLRLPSAETAAPPRGLFAW